MDETPRLSELYICEKVIFEQGSGNVSLLNIFQTRVVDSFPSEPFPIVVYGALTDGYGAFTIEFRIVHLESDALVYRQSMAMVFTDRLQHASLICRLNKLSFKSQGKHDITVLLNGELPALATINVRKR